MSYDEDDWGSRHLRKMRIKEEYEAELALYLPSPPPYKPMSNHPYDIKNHESAWQEYHHIVRDARKPNSPIAQSIMFQRQLNDQRDEFASQSSKMFEMCMRSHLPNDEYD